MCHLLPPYCRSQTSTPCSTVTWPVSSWAKQKWMGHLFFWRYSLNPWGCALAPPASKEPAALRWLIVILYWVKILDAVLLHFSVLSLQRKHHCQMCTLQMVWHAAFISYFNNKTHGVLFSDTPGCISAALWKSAMLSPIHCQGLFSFSPGPVITARLMGEAQTVLRCFLSFLFLNQSEKI